ncbi:hypothetical protein GONAM_14_01310 [Gordonia namibiensis NBRC 108229]|uniref:RiboL-PSP-HEPN domain-containing protein n=1 Tax=Gordonia namibiensis NBRC 108229 TaxID=1208314 RepID=K6X2I7_9ACTN|nr:hypothetical protein [Gordonia namibiensis]GAC00272.1 hypothetical protein GONAM_14_01310 [Gordonia namibiensis NBRC 108229]
MREDMSEFEFQQTRVGLAGASWINFFERSHDYLRISHASIQAAVPLTASLNSIPKLLDRPLGLDEESRTLLHEVGTKAERELETGFELTNALVLMALWGAFEAFVEDVCKGAIFHDRTLLNEPGLNKARYTVSALIQLDEEHLIEQVFKDSVDQLRSDNRGIGKFEAQLGLVRLDGKVPREIKDAIFDAQQDRNVWAHRAGTADNRYVRELGRNRFRAGETVKISREKIEDYFLALMTYGTIIINRFREALFTSGTPPAAADPPVQLVVQRDVPGRTYIKYTNSNS